MLDQTRIEPPKAPPPPPLGPSYLPIPLLPHQAIVRRMIDWYGVSLPEIRSPSRRPLIRYARAELIVALYVELHWSQSHIRQFIHRGSHSCIRHALRAGVPSFSPRQYRSWSEDHTRALTNAAARGLGATEAAVEMGFPVSTIWQRAKQLGIRLGGRNRTRFTAEEDAEMLRLRAAGALWRDIALAMRRGRTTVRERYAVLVVEAA